MFTLPTKTQLIAYSLVTLTVFSLGVASHNTLVAARDSFNDLFGPKIATNATFSERITDHERAVNAKLATPEVQSLCHSQAEYAVLLDESAALEKQTSLTNAKRTATVTDIEDKTRALTSSTLQDLKSVRQEARIMIGK